MAHSETKRYAVVVGNEVHTTEVTRARYGRVISSGAKRPPETEPTRIRWVWDAPRRRWSTLQAIAASLAVVALTVLVYVLGGEG